MDFLRSIYNSITGFFDWFASSLDFLFPAFSDFVLDWGDWIAATGRALLLGSLSFFLVSWIWRFITVIWVAAFSGVATSILGTGIAVVVLAWLSSILFRLLGIGFVTYSVWSMGLVPDVEMLFLAALALAPEIFQPMLAYMGVPDALHFIFSSYLAVFTIKNGKWVFSGPTLFP